MTEIEIDNFEKNQSQLESLHTEISGLTKKSPNELLNKFKLKFVNQILDDSNKLLGKNYMPFNDFERFDEEALPSNSDVAMMLGQYLNCMEKLRSDNIQNRGGSWFWISDKGETNIRTVIPTKIIRK